MEGQLGPQVEGVFEHDILLFVFQDDSAEADFVIELGLDDDAFLVLFGDLLHVNAREVGQAPLFEESAGQGELALQFWG